jgi:hypothetical protein
VGDTDRPGGTSGLHQVLDDQRAGEGGDEGVLAHVHRVGLERRSDEVGRELVTGVDDDGLDRATVEGTLPDLIEVVDALADVDGAGDHLDALVLPHPLDGDGGVQTAGVGQDDAGTGAVGRRRGHGGRAHGSSSGAGWVGSGMGGSQPVGGRLGCGVGRLGCG